MPKPACTSEQACPFVSVSRCTRRDGSNFWDLPVVRLSRLWGRVYGDVLTLGMPFITLHRILTAWRDGNISAATAMHVAQIDTEAELHEAAMLSGVLPMRPRTAEEREHQAQVDAILTSVGAGAAGKTA